MSPPQKKTKTNKKQLPYSEAQWVRVLTTNLQIMSSIEIKFGIYFIVSLLLKKIACDEPKLSSPCKEVSTCSRES